jgi:phage-related protein (TIGR01555 family)
MVIMSDNNTKLDNNPHYTAAAIKDNVNYDGWSNIQTRLGNTPDDRSSQDYVSPGRILSDMELNNIYQYTGLGRKIVDIYAEESTREWISISGDNSGQIEHQLNLINAKDAFSDLIRWALLFGGAVIVIGADDGRDLTEPLNENSLKSIESLTVYDRTEVIPDYVSFYNNPENTKFGKPSIYSIQPSSTFLGAANAIFYVHETRVLRMDGLKLPNRAFAQNQFWGGSFVQSAFTALSNLGSSYRYSANIIADFVQTILSIENLQDLIGSEGGEDLLMKRLMIMNRGRSVNNTVLLDSKEQYTKQASSVAGLSELLDKFMQQLAAVTKIPEMILMGKSPSGLQSSGEDDIRSFYDSIKSYQRKELYSRLHRLVSLMLKTGQITNVPSQWDIIFNPLWQMSDGEKADLHLKQAQSDQIYINMGVLDPAEVKMSRFGTPGNPKDFDLATEVLFDPLEPDDLDLIDEGMEDDTEEGDDNATPEE